MTAEPVTPAELGRIRREANARRTAAGDRIASLERIREPDLERVERMAEAMTRADRNRMIHPTDYAYLGRAILSALGYKVNDVTLDSAEAEVDA